jgi:energy-coupling factor transporter ATP-binding protein EcfA2
MVENWSQRLSLDEQQRLAFARILLAKPAIFFLDETTSALDELTEAQLYGLLRAAPWRPTVVSFGRRSTLRNFHDHVLDLAAFRPRREKPPPTPPLFVGNVLNCARRSLNVVFFGAGYRESRRGSDGRRKEVISKGVILLRRKSRLFSNSNLSSVGRVRRTRKRTWRHNVHTNGYTANQWHTSFRKRVFQHN